MKKIILIFLSLILWLLTVYASSTIAIDRKSSILPYQWVRNWYYDSSHNEWLSYKPESRFSFVNWTSPWENTFVKDSVTGLMWNSKPDWEGKRWQDAINYCDNLVKWWYDDWRLPSNFELRTLIDYSNTNLIDSNFFMNTWSEFWTSTECAYDRSKAWHVQFGLGYTPPSAKTSKRYALCVR